MSAIFVSNHARQQNRLLALMLSLLLPLGDVAGQEVPTRRAGFTPSQGGFYRQYWADRDQQMNNSSKSRRFDVNDENLSLHARYGHTPEAPANGLVLIKMPESLFTLDRAELYVELWGGHHHTSQKRFIPNGHAAYPLPDVGAARGHLTFSYPVIPLTLSHLVTGVNALQFACEGTWWGHYFLDEAALRVWVKPDHPGLVEAGLDKFQAQVRIPAGMVSDDTELLVDIPPGLITKVRAVHYYGKYYGYDDNGDGIEDDWHGHTHHQIRRDHVGTATMPPFNIIWDTRMIPTQGEGVTVMADVELEGGFVYRTAASDAVRFPAGRPVVQLYSCSQMPVSFHSRANRLNSATIVLPGDISEVAEAILVCKTWDGGAGKVKEPFKINGHAYAIATDRGPHQTVYTRRPVDVAHLQPGANTLTLISDTKAHGIEVLLPGPALILRWNRSERKKQ